MVKHTLLLCCDDCDCIDTVVVKYGNCDDGNSAVVVTAVIVAVIVAVLIVV